ncbi:hypothetical protein Zmor_006146 [Zophobas morio]|uniref:Uncharacterized protein n=1 Tax=Zophobas morio TaxID=2755281 RepID=A0AA38MML8_9CUCU|nr:hypothetical protein Zmor_006146 [Zophobas morio]
MSTSDEDTSVCTPPEIRKEASNVQCDQLLPQKSKEFYLKVYAQFKDWCKIKKVAKVSENVLLVYMEEKAKNKKASSLWATFSMLKQTLKLKENVDISKYYKVIAFLKRKNDSYTPKKAAVFEKHQITKFILEAPDEIFLSSKVILIIGIAGACRTDELCNMKMTDRKHPDIDILKSNETLETELTEKRKKPQLDEDNSSVEHDTNVDKLKLTDPCTPNKSLSTASTITLRAPVLLRHRKAPRMVSAEEIDILKELIILLQPFEEVTKEISGQGYVTSSKVIPMVNCVLKKLNTLLPITSEGVLLKHNIIKEMEKRFSKIEEVKLLAISTILDPRFKKIHFDKSTACAQAISDINKCLFEDNDHETETHLPQKIKNTESPSIWCSFMNN